MTPGQRNQLATDVAVEAGTVTLSARGELDMATVGSMIDLATRHLTDGPHTLVVDFAGVTFCDSAGANGLIRLRNACDRAGCEFRLVGLRGHVRRVLVDLMGLGGLLNVPPADAGSTRE